MARALRGTGRLARLSSARTWPPGGPSNGARGALVRGPHSVTTLPIAGTAEGLGTTGGQTLDGLSTCWGFDGQSPHIWGTVTMQPVEFTAGEAAVLGRYFTNLDRPVFALR